MKVLILAGGYGTRLSEETDTKPKPMVEIGGKPIIWHIMKIYSSYGFNEFVILLGYKGYYIKEYFMNYFLHQNDVTIDMSNNSIEYHNQKAENWKITLLDTGLDTMTGGRILRAKEFINNERFMLTYGDGVSDVDMNKLFSFHKKHNKKITMTAIQPDGRFGALDLDGESVKKFIEKPAGDGNWINGGFFICEPEVLDYISSDQSTFEKEALEQLAEEDELVAYKHTKFWKCMDTLRDKHSLNDMWDSNRANWKVW